MKRWLVLLTAITACGGGAGEPASRETAPPTPSRLVFTDGTVASGLDTFVHRNGTADNRTIDESFGAGVALFDGREAAYRQENQVLENEGQGRFRVPTGLGGPGLAVRAASRGAAAGDIDGDGDVDLLVGNLDGPPTLLVNGSDTGNTLALRLISSGRNRTAIGAVVRARLGEQDMVHTVGAGSGFLSTSDLQPVFGLGEATTLTQVSVRWPDGSEEPIGELAAGRLHTIIQGQGVTASTLRQS